MQQGLDALRQAIASVAPHMQDRLGEIAGWDDVKLLTVVVDRLEQWWREGLLMIGDAAHAMSPVGGVGINLAVQDAVAAANRLAEPLRQGKISIDDLKAVERRRMFPTRATQWLQIAIQNRILSPLLAGTRRPTAPWPIRFLGRTPLLQRIPARLVGIGFRPEHIQTREQPSAKALF
jgi:2-polyprenyl-6-methoxyphenol hydroxylase-like FAD-dependent oxidoreductase